MTQDAQEAIKHIAVTILPVALAFGGVYAAIQGFHAPTPEAWMYAMLASASALAGIEIERRWGYLQS